VFQVESLKENPHLKELLLACGVTCAFFIPFNFYFTHLGNWLIYDIGLTATNMGLMEGIALLLAALMTIPFAKLINQEKTPLVALIAVLTNALGLILMFQTGMRVGELAVLKRENIQNGTIRVTATEESFFDPETGKRVCEPVDHAKTDAGERTILLPETAEKTLRAIRAINPFGEFLFMDKQGRRIRANRFNHWLHKACIKVGIP
jgi:integrase